MNKFVYTLKKYIAHLLVILSIFQVLPVYASYSNIEEKIQVNALNVNSKYEITLLAKPETTVSLEILYPEAEFPPISDDPTALMNSFAYIGQKTTDSNGVAVFTYSPQAEGEYTVRAGFATREMSIKSKEEDPLFALAWATTPTTFLSEKDNIYKSYWLSRTSIDTDTEQAAVNMKSFLADVPQGKKCVYVSVTGLAGGIFDEAFNDNNLWYDKGVADVKAAVENVFKEYQAIGGEIDYITIDMELYPMSTTTLGTDEKSVYNDIVKDERYITEIRPLLEERGYQFYTKSESENWFEDLIGGIIGNSEERSELYSIDTSPNDIIWNRVMENRTASYLNEAICEPIMKYYPEVKISNYGYIDGDGWHKVPFNSGGRYYLGGNSIKVGTHSNVSSYGTLGWMTRNPSGSSSNIGPEDYYGSMYEGTPFHSLLFDNNKLRKAWLSDDDKQVQAWVTAYDVNYGDGDYVFGYANTPYYAENVFHAGLLAPDPFLLFGVESKKVNGDSPTEEEKQMRVDVFSSVISELNEVVGFSDRRPLVKEIASWNNRYLLSGMYANGKNIWRITPDLSVEGMSVESFCTDTNTPTFYIDGQTITFPRGKIYTPTASNNTCGYWVITPESVEPVITYDKRTVQGQFGAVMQIYREDTGIKATKIPTDCSMTARVSLNNLTTKDEKLTLFMVSYEGDVLKTVSMLSSEMVSSGEDSIIVVEDIPKPDSSTTRVSFYLWGENLQPFVPLETLYR